MTVDGMTDNRDYFADRADTNKVTDYELMQLIASRDEAALAELYDRYDRLIMSVALAVVGDRATAEEVTLDIFLRAWQHAGTYDPNLSKVPTWLTRMARNRAIDRLRRESSRPAFNSAVYDDTVSTPLYSGDTETAVDLAMEKQRVRAAVASLPAEQRQVLFMAYFQGYTHSEIAGLLEQSLGTVKGRIRGGMARLREMLITDQLSIPSEPVPSGANRHDLK